MNILPATSAFRREVRSAVVMVIGVATATVVVPCLANAAPILNPLNGHYYQAFVFPEERDFLSWDAAESAAESLFFMGEQGYLATITSRQENDFLIVNFAP